MAIKIFKIGVARDCSWVLPSDIKRWVKLANGGFIAEPMRERWEEPSFYIRGPVTKITTDFIYVTAGVLAFTSSVYDSPIGELLGECGELLHANISDTRERFYIFNPLMCYNCLDRDKSKFRMTVDGAVVAQILKYQFFAERIGRSVFKIPDSRSAAIFTISGRPGWESEFYSHYDAAGFTGLKFEEVWSGKE